MYGNFKRIARSVFFGLVIFVLPFAAEFGYAQNYDPYNRLDAEDLFDNPELFNEQGQANRTVEGTNTTLPQNVQENTAGADDGFFTPPPQLQDPSLTVEQLPENALGLQQPGLPATGERESSPFQPLGIQSPQVYWPSGVPPLRAYTELNQGTLKLESDKDRAARELPGVPGSGKAENFLK